LHGWLQQLYVCLWPGRYKQERKLWILISPFVSNSSWSRNNNIHQLIKHPCISGNRSPSQRWKMTQRSFCSWK
jgi:hypothetical protein